MNAQSLPEMLNDLLHEAGDEGMEVCLAESASLTALEHGSVSQEYEHRYTCALQSVKRVRGQAHFSGTRRDRDYPDWHDAAQLSYWHSAAGFVYVALCDQPTGLRLLAGARPHPFERETITLMPPAD